MNIPARLKASKGDYLVNAAVEGLGVFIGPAFIVQSALKNGLLEAALTGVDWAPTVDDVGRLITCAVNKQ